MRLSIKYLIGCSILLVLGLALVISGSFFLFQFSDDTKPRVFQAYLYDPDGDGDLDAFLVYLNEVNRILHNDGTGRFTFAEGFDDAPATPWPWRISMAMERWRRF